MNKFKAWLIRKLGGYVHMYEPPIVFKCSERPIITLHTTVLSPRYGRPQNMEKEIIARQVSDALAKLIYENECYTMRETYSIEDNRKTYEITMDVVKRGD